MSFWGFDGEDTTLTSSWTSLNQLDDMVWNELGQANGDHVVPGPNYSTESSWFSQGDGRKRQYREASPSGSTFRTSTTSTGAGDNLSEIMSGMGHVSDEEDGFKEGLLLEDPLSTALVGDGWTDIGTLKETSALYIREGSANIVTDPFSVSDVGSQHEALEMFGNESVAARKADNLLELGWENIGNLDDMERLFRNNDTGFEPVLVNGTDGLDWASSSPPLGSALDNGTQFEKSAAVSGLTSVKVEVDRTEDTTETVLRHSLPSLALDGFDGIVADSGSPQALNLSANDSLQESSRPTDKRVSAGDIKPSDAILNGKESANEEAGQVGGSVPETEKASLAQASRARRHAANRKRSEERDKRVTSYRKLSPGPPYNGPHVEVRPRQTIHCQLPHLQPTSAYPFQIFPPAMSPGPMSAPHQLRMLQNLPYAQVGYPLHHVPAMSSCPSTTLLQIQQPETMFLDPELPHLQIPRKPHVLPHLLPQPSPLASKQPQRQHQLGQPFDSSCQPPIRSPSMTPQEKMEKLRWRQQMQARMAVEQQQQLLASQDYGGPNHNPRLTICHSLLTSQPGNHLTPTGSVEELMNPELEAGQRLVVRDGDVPPTNETGEEDEDHDSSLEASVLYQLKATVGALDIDTRLCIRDALFRLARSAMKRRAAGGDTLNGNQDFDDNDANAVESSTASGPPSTHSRATSMSMVETETNSIDRSIAQLLFSNPPIPIFGRTFVYRPEDPPFPGMPQLPVEPFVALSPRSQ